MYINRYSTGKKTPGGAGTHARMSIQFRGPRDGFVEGWEFITRNENINLRPPFSRLIRREPHQAEALALKGQRPVALPPAVEL